MSDLLMDQPCVLILWLEALACLHPMAFTVDRWLPNYRGAFLTVAATSCANRFGQV